MKFIYCTDIHYGATPVCRKDDYNMSILTKLKYIVRYANDNEIDLVVVGGDLFDRPHQNYMDLIEMITLIRMSDLKWIINRGNPTHDGVVENSPLTLISSMDGNVITSDNKKSVTIGNEEFIFCPNSVDINSYEEVEPLVDGVDRFILTHHIIVKESVPYKHILCQDFAEKIKYDSVVFLADYHPKQGDFMYENSSGVNVRFISTGSICRRKYTKDNIEKIPQFCVFDTDSGECEFVEIPFEKDVWNIPEDNVIEETELDMSKFKENIDDFQEEMNLESAWNRYVAENDFPEEITNMIYESIKKGFK